MTAEVARGEELGRVPWSGTWGAVGPRRLPGGAQGAPGRCSRRLSPHAPPRPPLREQLLPVGVCPGYEAGAASVYNAPRAPRAVSLPGTPRPCPQARRSSPLLLPVPFPASPAPGGLCTSQQAAFPAVVVFPALSWLLAQCARGASSGPRVHLHGARGRRGHAHSAGGQFGGKQVTVPGPRRPPSGGSGLRCPGVPGWPAG